MPAATRQGGQVGVNCAQPFQGRGSPQAVLGTQWCPRRRIDPVVHVVVVVVVVIVVGCC